MKETMIQKLIIAFSVLGVVLAADTCAPVCENGDEGLYPNPQNCSTFYQCSFGEAVLKECPAGLQFNPELLVCDYPGTFECTEDPGLDCGGSETTTTSTSTTTTSTTTTSTTTQKPSTTSTSTERTTKTTPDAVTTTANPSSCFPPCPSATAIYANPRDCTTYFMCFGSIPYLQTCNPGDEYNPASETCETAGSFECSAGPDAPCVAVTVSPSKFS